MPMVWHAAISVPLNGPVKRPCLLMGSSVDCFWCFDSRGNLNISLDIQNLRHPWIAPGDSRVVDRYTRLQPPHSGANSDHEIIRKVDSGSSLRYVRNDGRWFCIRTKPDIPSIVFSCEHSAAGKVPEEKAVNHIAFSCERCAAGSEPRDLFASPPVMSMAQNKAVCRSVLARESSCHIASVYVRLQASLLQEALFTCLRSDNYPCQRGRWRSKVLADTQ